MFARLQIVRERFTARAIAKTTMSE